MSQNFFYFTRLTLEYNELVTVDSDELCCMVNDAHITVFTQNALECDSYTGNQLFFDPCDINVFFILCIWRSRYMFGCLLDHFGDYLLFGYFGDGRC